MENGYNHGTTLYYVFVQHDSDGRYQMEGEVWAPNDQLALFYAKEQFARRGRCSGLWVVRKEAIVAASPDWSDAYVQDGRKRWRHASFFSAGREETPDLVRRLIREGEEPENVG